MNIFREYTSIVSEWAEKEWPGSAHALRNMIVDIPPNFKFGHMTTNAALILSKYLQKSVYEIAELLGQRLLVTQTVKTYEVTRHGFVNWRFKADVLETLGNHIYTIGKNWDRNFMEPKQRVMVEYVSANPTGPLHIGHVRGAVLGDVVANLLEYQGWDVIREYYINDAGNQINTLIGSAYERYREALGLMFLMPEKGYAGEYLKDFAREIVKEFDDSLVQFNCDGFAKEHRDRLINWMMDWIRKDLEDIGIVHNIYTSEDGIKKAGFIEAALGELSIKGMTYLGESLISNPTYYPIVFKSTGDGDDKDRVLQRANGEYTYFAGDIGYIKQKQKRGFDRIIQFMGQDHQGYEKRLLSAAKELTDDTMNMEISFFEMVNLLEDGIPVKMSKRADNMVTLRDLLNDVDKDSIRFFMAWRKSNEIIDFDTRKVTEENANNPLWYIQYASARINSVIDKAIDIFPDIHENGIVINQELLNEHSIKMLMLVMRWPLIVQKATDHLEPHRMAIELYNIAKEFHKWYQVSNKKDNMFVQADRITTGHNLAIIILVYYAIVNGLELLGIEPKKELRWNTEE
jgi:arginyl-tRNA synthetase